MSALSYSVPREQTQIPFLKRKSVRSMLHKISIYLICIILSVIILFPISWLLTAALKAKGESIYTIPVSWFPTTSFHFENFWTVLNYPTYPLWRPILNTLFLVVVNVIGCIFSNAIIGYAFARLRFPGRDFLFQVVIFTMFVPSTVLMIPQFLVFLKLGWYGTYLPLWVPAFFGSAWNIFIVRQYMRSFPKDLDEAALLDGCNHFQIFTKIILPLSKPVLAVVAVFTILNVWNDFTRPIIYLNNQAQFTLSIGLNYFRTVTRSGLNPNLSLVMAGAFLSMLPMLLLYYFTQEQLVGGIASVGVKG
jgi:multiple sugar transport system permease protein